MADPILLAVNGTLMRGLELNGNLLAVGAEFVREDRTVAAYRLFSIRDRHPGMVRVTNAGIAVPVEVWAVPPAGLGQILLQEPPGLSIGKVQLLSGDETLGVLAEPILCEGQREISGFGGWREYCAARERGEVATQFSPQLQLPLPRVLPLLLAALLAVFAFTEATAKPPEPLYETRAEHDRNGIGKFFMGREIAHVMGHQAADWLERPEREAEERTDLLIDALKLREGEVVADIGCGSGFIARKIAKKIGATGVVYGVEIQQEMLDVLAKRMAMFRIENVKPVLGTTTDPKLPPAACDTMIMVDVYHEFDFPYEMVQAMIPALKPGGRIVFVEYRKEDPAVPIKEVHKMSEAQVKKEMTAHPQLAYAETIGTLPRQHVIVFRKK